MNNLALLKNTRGDHVAAEALLRQSIEMRKEAGRDPSVGIANVNLGHALAGQGKLEEAEKLYREALAMFRDVLAPTHGNITATLFALSRVHRSRGELDEAGAMLDEAEETLRSQPEDHPLYGVLFDARSLLRLDRGDLPGAERWARKGLEIRLAKLAPGHGDVAASKANLGRILIEEGRGAEAEPLLREALEARRALLVSGHWILHENEGVLGAAIASQGRFAEAESLLVSSESALSTHPWAPPARKQEASERLAAFYVESGRSGVAAASR